MHCINPQQQDAEATPQRLAPLPVDMLDVLETIADGLITLDIERRFTYVNRAAEVIVGKGREQLLGQRVWEVHAAVLRPLWERRNHETLNSGQVLEFEEFCVPLSRWFQVRVHATQRGYTLYLQDITERKQAEETLQANEERFHTVWESAADAMALSNAEGIVLAANPAYYQLYGYPPEQVIGQDFALIFPPEWHAQVMAEYRTIFQAPAPPAMVESVVRRADGGQRVVETRVNFVTQNGERTLMLSTIRDITQRKQVEAERDELLTRERAAHMQAQASVRAREQLLSIISHDLKNPLTVIQTTAHMLQRQVTGIAAPVGGKISEGLARIDRATKGMTDMLNELLDFASIQAGQPLQLTCQVTDLVALARQLTTEYQQGALQHQICFVTSTAELMGIWDAARLQRVLGNLLSNALKYSPWGGTVTVSVGREQEGRSAWAVLRMQDPGIGIPAQELPHIFDWFYRAKNISQQISGTGIGLASVRQIVEQHGGTITVVSEEGLGSTFTLRLPLETL